MNDYDIPTLAKPGCAVCESMEPYAVHWQSPLDSGRPMVIVAESCSGEHSDLIESARKSTGRLTVAAVARVAKEAKK